MNEILDAVNCFGPYFFSCNEWDVSPCTPENNIHNHPIVDEDIRCNIAMTIKFPNGEVKTVLHPVTVSSIPKEWKDKMNIFENVKKWLGVQP